MDEPCVLVAESRGNGPEKEGRVTQVTQVTQDFATFNTLFFSYFPSKMKSKKVAQNCVTCVTASPFLTKCGQNQGFEGDAGDANPSEGDADIAVGDAGRARGRSQIYLVVLVRFRSTPMPFLARTCLSRMRRSLKALPVLGNSLASSSIPASSAKSFSLSNRSLGLSFTAPPNGGLVTNRMMRSAMGLVAKAISSATSRFSLQTVSQSSRPHPLIQAALSAIRS